jgi:hypothetical protein
MDDLKKAMGWVKVRTTLIDHRKIRYLIADVKKIQPDFDVKDAWGSLVLLWVRCAHQYPDGEITGRFAEEEIAQLCGWTEDPQKWVKALCDTGWLEKIEKGYAIHQWEEHTEDWWHYLSKDAETKERKRKNSKNYRHRLRQDAEEGRILKEQKGPEYDSEPLRKPPHKPFVTGASPVNSGHVTGASSEISGDSPVTSPGKIEEFPPIVSDQKNTENEELQSTSIIFPVTGASPVNNGDVTGVSPARDRGVPLGREGVEGVKKEKDGVGDCADPEIGSSPTPTLIKFFLDAQKDKLGEIPKGFKPAMMGKTIKGLLAEVGETEVRRRMQNWFDSTWPWVREEARFRWFAFMTKWEELESGPLKPFEKTGGKTYGRFDRPKDIPTRDDFS